MGLVRVEPISDSEALKVFKGHDAGRGTEWPRTEESGQVVETGVEKEGKLLAVQAPGSAEEAEKERKKTKRG